MNAMKINKIVMLFCLVSASIMILAFSSCVSSGRDGDLTLTPLPSITVTQNSPYKGTPSLPVSSSAPASVPASTPASAPASVSAPASAQASTSAVSPATSAPVSENETMNIAVYYLKDKNGLYLVREVHKLKKTLGVAKAALNELISSSPFTEGAYRIIPPDTKILGINIDNGIATVDFSGEVLDAQTGSGGESLGIQSIVNTLTEFPSIDAVRFTVEGSVEKAIDWWGHVGLYQQPFRQDLTYVYEPPVWIITPFEGQDISPGFTLRGSARVFEATVSYRIRDEGGTVLASGFVTADKGAPDRGEFISDISFTPSTGGEGSIEVFEVSMKDGSDLHMVTVPVKW